MDFLMEVLEKIQSIVWGPPTLILLVGTGLYFTFRLKFLQITKFGKSMKLIFEKEEGQGDVSAFGSLCTTLAATIG
ncbi:MAG: sodium:alanine symporter family protein, partial [Oscillospiraceae bacterium]